MIGILSSNAQQLGSFGPGAIETDVAAVLGKLFANHSVKPAPHDDSATPAEARRWAELAQSLKDRIITARRASGSLSFDDMVEILKELLEDKSAGAAVRDQLRAQFKLVLIDEFQDTDMSQWKIFSDVFTPEKGENSRVMIMVGDPKQAIYRFRGADVSAYIGAVNQPGVTRHNMTVNWRSDADLIAALNQLMQGCDFGQGCGRRSTRCRQSGRGSEADSDCFCLCVRQFKRHWCCQFVAVAANHV